MMKNNKGFMLVEVIITSTVIIAAMVGLYSSFNRLYQSYDTKNYYYSIDGVYATKETINYLLQNDFSDQYLTASDTKEKDFNYFINDLFYNTGTDKFLIKDGSCNAKISGDFCTSIVNLYQVKNMILLEYDKCSFVFDSDHNTKYSCGLSSNKFLSIKNQTFKEYLDYVVSYYDMTNTSVDSNENNKYSYIILTEIYDGEYYYYSNLRVR